MATERLSMRKIREILRLKWVLGKSHRDAARSLGVSPATVAGVVSRARHAMRSSVLGGSWTPGEPGVLYVGCGHLRLRWTHHMGLSRHHGNLRESPGWYG
jgi:hypothetical protein